MCSNLPKYVNHFHERRILYFRTFIREQWGNGESLVRNNVFKNIIAVFNTISYEPLRAAILNDYPEIAHVKKVEVIRVPEKGEPAIVIEERKTSKLNLVAQRERSRAQDEDSVVIYALSQKLPATDGEFFFAKCTGAGWTNNGKPIRDWRQTLRAWAINGYLPSKRKPVSKHAENGEAGPQLPLI